VSKKALAKARNWGAHHTVLADDDPVANVMEITRGAGGRVVFDFVGERGAEAQGIAMTSNAGSYYVIGSGGQLTVPTIDIAKAASSATSQARTTTFRNS
jgi:NAD+-dependent secondary alcohol dehydrogenase Adh1